MTPVDFPQSNCRFGPPDGLDESQVFTIHAFKGKVLHGSMDGADTIIVAWLPDEKEREDINSGKPIYLSVLGGCLPPHCLATEVEFK